MRSLDIRYKAIVHYLYFCRSIRKVAKLYGVSKTSLHRWIRQSGGFIARNARKNRSRKSIRSEVAAVIEKTLQHNPFTTVDKLAVVLKDECGVHVSRSTASRWTKAAGYTWKKAFKAVTIQHDPSSVMDFCNRYRSCKRDDIVCVDEMAFYVGERPKRGYALKGRRLNVPSTRSLRHKKYTVVMAVSRQGIVRCDVLDSNCNTHHYAHFIDCLPCSAGTTLLMDNVSFHKSKQVVDAMRIKGYMPLYIPPYSPRVNAIENVFAMLKIRFRSRCPTKDDASFDYKSTFVQLVSSTEPLDAFFDRVDRIVDEAFLCGGEGFRGIDP